MEKNTEREAYTPSKNQSDYDSEYGEKPKPKPNFDSDNKYGERDREIKLIKKDFKYDPKKGIEKATQNDQVKFSLFIDEQGQEVIRFDYDEKGRIRTMRLAKFDKGNFNYSEAYNLCLDYFRKVNQEGQIEERTPEGDLIRILKE